jgi:predicted ATPase
LATSEGFPHFLGAATTVRAWTAAGEKPAEVELEQMRRGVAAWRATGAAFLVPYFLGLLARAHARVDEATTALDRVAEALALVEGTNERWYEAELRRLRGELLLGLPEPDPAEAEACFRHALAGARGQGARMWELRAATSLARLWDDRGRRAEARDLLAPVHGWFTEGLGTQDLRQTKVLLQELASAP